ncbi:hypothetical protein RDABS01_032453 [Bienertia sinuspersici]
MKTTIHRIFGTLGQEEERLNNMRSRYQLLCSQAEYINTEVEYTELHPQRKRKRVVDNWMKCFKELQAKVHHVEHGLQEGTSTSSGHMTSRNQVVKITREIEELMEQKKSLGELTLGKPANSSLPLVTTKLKGHMFQEYQRRILSWLKNDRFSKIGVYGVGGVGKTALLMQAHNDILENFNNLNQGEVYTSKSKDMFAGAAILLEGLKDVKEIVIFLDDMWEYFPLKEIGIPVEAKNFKYIISTRNAEVVRRVDCQQSLRLEPLVKEEAWTLFREKLGSYEKLSMEAKIIAREIAEECGGLPLGIKIMATSLTEVADIHTWRDVLAELRNSNRGHPDMEIQVLQALKVSSAYLKNELCQQCFLLCALFPEDYQVSRHELIILMLSMGLLEGMQTRREQVDKGHTVLKKLEDACLLDAITDVNQVRYVKMHKLVRDMAIRIAMEGHHCLIQSRVELRKAPDDQEWKENLKTVSLMRMDRLLNLKSLDLKGTKDGLSLQGLLPSFPAIQFLKLDYNVKGVMGEDLLELEHLEGLEGWCTSHLSSFNQYVISQHHQKLHYYDFVVGSGRFIRFLHELENDKLNILDRNVRIYNTKIGENVEALVLPLNMQYLQIQQCAPAPLQNLRELILWDLPEMRGLVEEGFIPPPGTFSNLKKLSIKCCPKIKSLSSFSLNNLQNLEELKVEECIELEKLIPSIASETKMDTKNKEDVTLNQFSIQGSISLSFPNLKSCIFPIKLSLSTDQETSSPLPDLQEIRVDEGWWESLEWSDPQLKQVEEQMQARTHYSMVICMFFLSDTDTDSWLAMDA